MWAVDKRAAIQLQHFVNDGHEPWRLNDIAVAEAAVNSRKHAWADDNTVLKAPEIRSKTRDRVRAAAISEDGKVRYEVTLRRYPWLLNSAKDKWQWVIWLPASVERIDCNAQGH